MKAYKLNKEEYSFEQENVKNIGQGELQMTKRERGICIVECMEGMNLYSPVINGISRKPFNLREVCRYRNVYYIPVSQYDKYLMN